MMADSHTQVQEMQEDVLKDPTLYNLIKEVSEEQVHCFLPFPCFLTTTLYERNDGGKHGT